MNGPVEFSQSFVAFLEYMNFNNIHNLEGVGGIKIFLKFANG